MRPGVNKYNEKFEPGLQNLISLGLSRYEMLSVIATCSWGHGSREIMWFQFSLPVADLGQGGARKSFHL